MAASKTKYAVGDAVVVKCDPERNNGESTCPAVVLSVHGDGQITVRTLGYDHSAVVGPYDPSTDGVEATPVAV